MKHLFRGFRILQLSCEKNDGNTYNLAEYRRLNKKHSRSNSARRSTVGIQNSLLYSDRNIPLQIVADNHNTDNTETVDTQNSLYSDHKIPEEIVTDSRLYDEKCSSYTDTVDIQNSSDSEDVDFLNHGYDEDATDLYTYIYRYLTVMRMKSLIGH